MANRNPRMNTQQFHAAKDLRRVVRIIEDYSVELVSYGLAPNPDEIRAVRKTIIDLK